MTPDETSTNAVYQILVVEDSLTQAVRLQYILEDNNYQVAVVRNGKEALDWLKTQQPTLIISDIVMPEMDGYELCRQVKANPSLKDIPIILLTALSDLQDVARALESGASNFVTKPYTAEFLLSRVKHILVNQELRKRSTLDSGGIEIYFANQKFNFSSEPTQMIDLLLSTFENAVQKNMELQQANQQLVAMQQELKQKNVSLEKLNEQKNRFLGMASHDLRNPLGNISAVSDLLLDYANDGLDDEQKEMLSIIKTSSEFMVHLIDELLDIATIESGQLQLSLESANLIELAQRNVHLNQMAASKKDIQLAFNHPDTMPEVIIDRAKIEQVLNNLISNAIKFSHPGTRVEINVVPNGQAAIISVKDQGQGIPAAEQSKLFQPFARTSVKSTQGEKSTGLGLAIVNNIVQGHGGKLWVESEVGQGSTFFVSLPYAQE